MQMKKKNKKGHWYFFEFVRGSESYRRYYELRIFAVSAREGRYFITRDYPDAWIIYQARLDARNEVEKFYLVNNPLKRKVL